MTTCAGFFAASDFCILDALKGIEVRTCVAVDCVALEEMRHRLNNGTTIRNVQDLSASFGNDALHLDVGRSVKVSVDVDADVAEDLRDCFVGVCIRRGVFALGGELPGALFPIPRRRASSSVGDLVASRCRDGMVWVQCLIGRK